MIRIKENITLNNINNQNEKAKQKTRKEGNRPDNVPSIHQLTCQTVYKSCRDSQYKPAFWPYRQTDRHIYYEADANYTGCKHAYSSVLLGQTSSCIHFYVNSANSKLDVFSSNWMLKSCHGGNIPILWCMHDDTSNQLTEVFMINFQISAWKLSWNCFN